MKSFATFAVVTALALVSPSIADDNASFSELVARSVKCTTGPKGTDICPPGSICVALGGPAAVMDGFCFPLTSSPSPQDETSAPDTASEVVSRDVDATSQATGVTTGALCKAGPFVKSTCPTGQFCLPTDCGLGVLCNGVCIGAPQKRSIEDLYTGSLAVRQVDEVIARDDSTIEARGINVGAKCNSGRFGTPCPDGQFCASQACLGILCPGNCISFTAKREIEASFHSMAARSVEGIQNAKRVNFTGTKCSAGLVKKPCPEGQLCIPEACLGISCPGSCISLSV